MSFNIQIYSDELIARSFNYSNNFVIIANRITVVFIQPSILIFNLLEKKDTDGLKYKHGKIRTFT